MTIDPEKDNIQDTDRIVGDLKAQGKNRLLVKYLPEDPVNARYDAIIQALYRLMDFEESFAVELAGYFPYCLFTANSRDHILPMAGLRGEKTGSCRKCKFNSLCAGFPPGYLDVRGRENVRPIKDLPCEVMFEIEPRCNFSCAFCYNHNSFAGGGREKAGNISLAYAKQVIDSIRKAGIPVVRFTGGEPLLYPQLTEVMTYAKERGLQVWLNTNASLLDASTCRRLAGLVDNVLIPIESWSDEREAEITGHPSALTKKLDAIRRLHEFGVPVIRAGTVATGANIKNFYQLANLIAGLPLLQWEFYRPVSAPGAVNQTRASDMAELAGYILEYRRRTDKYVMIANTVPFCAASDPNLLNAVSFGAAPDEGHSRFVVDPRGFAKPHYFIEKNIGNPRDILACWNNGFMRKMRHLGFLPEDCRDCVFRLKCRGGSRFEAEISSGDLSGIDPLADTKNKIIQSDIN